MLRIPLRFLRALKAHQIGATVAGTLPSESWPSAAAAAARGARRAAPHVQDYHGHLTRAAASNAAAGVPGRAVASAASSGAAAAAAVSSSAVAAAAGRAAPGWAAAAALQADMAKARRIALPVGTLAGVFGSVAGAGGAAVILPIMGRACQSIPQRVLSGTSLAAVLSTALVSTATFTSSGCVDYASALLIAPPAVLLAPLGARWTSRLNCQALKRLLGYFLLAAAPLVPLKAYIFSSRQQAAAAGETGQAGVLAGSGGGSAAGSEAPAAGAAASQPEAAAPPAVELSSSKEACGSLAGALRRLQEQMPAAPVAAGLVATGAAAGFASGLLGIGGGTIATPLVALIMPWGQAMVLGTSLLAMVPPSAVGLLQHHRLGNVDWRLAGGLALGTLLGGAAGSQAAVHAPNGVLEACFTAGMLVLARSTLRGAR